MTVMEEKTLSRKVWDAAARWATFCTLLVAIIGYSIGDHQKIMAHDAIIQAYELHGTPQTVKLQTQADEKFKSIERRLELLEQIITTIPDIRVELVKASAKLDAMHDSLERHMLEKPK